MLKKGEISANRVSILTFIPLNLWLQKKNSTIPQSFGTTIAEKLGHIKYSQLIQDCYYDLTEIVIKYHAEIYQYVGDEVILTWKTDDGLKENNCLNVFFAYNQLIKRKGEYYSKNYGLEKKPPSYLIKPGGLTSEKLLSRISNLSINRVFLKS